MAAFLIIGLILSVLFSFYILQRLLHRHKQSATFSKDGRPLVYDGDFSKGSHDHLYVFGHAVVANAFCLESATSLNSQDIRKALTMLIRRFPMLRMKFRWVDRQSGKASRYLQEMDDPCDAQYIYAEEDLDAANWTQRMEAELHRPLGDTGPLWRIIRLKEQHVGNKFLNTFLYTYHHSISDGLSMLALLQKFLEYLDADDEFGVEALPVLPPVADLLQHETTLSWWKACLFKLKHFVMRPPPPPKNLYLQKFPPVMKRDPTVSRRTCVMAKSLTQQETLQLVQHCKAHHCTVTGALMAATAISLSKIMQGGSAKLPLSIDMGTAVNVRDQCRPTVDKESFGRFVSFCMLRLHLLGIQNLKADFWKTARELSEMIQCKLKNKEQFAIYKMLRYHVRDPIDDFTKLSQDFENMGRRSLVAEFSNRGRFHCQTARYKLLALHFAVAQHFCGALFGHNIVTVNDQLYYTLVYSSHVVSSDQAKELFESAFSILKHSCCN